MEWLKFYLRYFIEEKNRLYLAGDLYFLKILKLSILLPVSRVITLRSSTVSVEFQGKIGQEKQK